MAEEDEHDEQLLGEQAEQMEQEEINDAEEEHPLTCKISLVHQIAVGKATVWYPDTQQVQGADGGLFFRISRLDNTLTKIVLGKSLQRHKKRSKEVRSLVNLEFWDVMHKKRKDACDAALKKQLEDAAGMEIARCRPARLDDRFLVSKSVVLTLPVVAIDDINFAEREVRTLWQLRGDIWLEMSEEVVLHVVYLLRQSPIRAKPVVKVKASPKRKRKLKRRRSASADEEVTG